MADLERSAERAVMVPFRMSTERKQDLKTKAVQHGLSVQAYLERAVWGEVSPHTDDQLELPMTG